MPRPNRITLGCYVYHVLNRGELKGSGTFLRDNMAAYLIANVDITRQSQVLAALLGAKGMRYSLAMSY